MIWQSPFGGGGTPALGMTTCSGDPGAKQLEAVNDLLRQASQLISETTTPGFLEIWDGSDGNLLRQYAVPTVDALAPTPVFTYNSLALVTGSAQAFGSGWVMSFLQSLSGSTTARSNATVTKGTGTSFTYTNRNATTGVYTAPPNALNKLVGNANGTWTETQPDGLTLNYNSSGKLATVKCAGDTWTLTYDASAVAIHAIKDPVNRVASFVYQGAVSGGHSKPASVGEMKTSHFEAKGIRRRPSAVVPPLSEAEDGESARNGDCSVDFRDEKGDATRFIDDGGGTPAIGMTACSGDPAPSSSKPSTTCCARPPNSSPKPPPPAFSKSGTAATATCCGNTPSPLSTRWRPRPSSPTIPWPPRGTARSETGA